MAALEASPWSLFLTVLMLIGLCLHARETIPIVSTWLCCHVNVFVRFTCSNYSDDMIRLLRYYDKNRCVNECYNFISNVIFEENLVVQGFLKNLENSATNVELLLDQI